MRTDLRQPMDVGRIVDWALRIYRLQFPAFFLIACVTIPFNLLGGVLLTVLLPTSPAAGDAPRYVLYAVVLLAGFYVNYLASAAIAFSVDGLDRNQPVDFSRAYDAVFARIVPLTRAIVHVLTPVLLLWVTTIGIPLAIWLSVRWLLLEQVVMIDGATGQDAPARSARLVQGSWWRILGIWLLLVLLGLIPLVVAAAATSLGPVLVASLVTSGVAAFALPFMAIGRTLLFFDLTARKESHVAPA